jgi:hypothetical protein
MKGNIMTQGPLTSAFELGHENAMRQELTTYYVENGNIIKSVVTRVYFKDRDYIDTTTQIVIGKAS